jgi:NAD(P)-dependent dehydrogenase (short-subunit alcohol dehydrogenase family)
VALSALPFVSFAKDARMRRVFITGSTDGLGRGAAQTLIAAGHQVVLHARTKERAEALADLAPKAAGVVIGDLASAAQTRSLAEQVNELGRMDAVIHNAGIFRETARGSTPEGHAKVLAVNVLAPYLLTALIERPARLVYLSSSMHRGGEGSLDDIDWTKRSWDTFRAYAESKLYVTALAFAVARNWPQVFSNAVDPGWVPTRMGGRGAPDDLEQGHLTQTWLATSDDAAARSSGGLWYHRQRQEPAPQARDPRFQDELVAKLAAITGTRLF